MVVEEVGQVGQGSEGTLPAALADVWPSSPVAASACIFRSLVHSTAIDVAGEFLVEKASVTPTLHCVFFTGIPNTGTWKMSFCPFPGCRSECCGGARLVGRSIDRSID